MGAVMSAFICGPDHFIALGVFAASRGTHGDAKVDPRYIKGCEQLHGYRPAQLACAYADILYAENARSVLRRYPDDDLESAPGPIEKPEHITVKAGHFNDVRWVLKPVDILKMCACLEYQSCETDDWESTPAFRLVHAIKEAAIRSLPGYEDAPWDYYAPTKAEILARAEAKRRAA